MKYLVQTRQNLTACDTVVKRGPTNRTLSEEIFNSEEEAIESYERQKSSLRFAGLAGQYVTFPRQVEDDYVIHTHYCDECGDGFSNDAYADINGDFCSKNCFRNNYQNSEEGSYQEDYYEDY